MNRKTSHKAPSTEELKKENYSPNPTFAQPQAGAIKATPYSTKGPKTRITVKYDIGFGRMLFLRGRGANLSWDKGVALKNMSADEWVWETDTPFSTCEFKVLINDREYEIGENHPLTCGANVSYTPRFN
jgi:hypothetical protein